MPYDKILDIMQELSETQAELEELNECGDLEDRMECLMRIDDIENRLFRARMKDTGGL